MAGCAVFAQGYRMVRCTHGAAGGAWYCEARIEHLGATGSARLGWCGHARLTRLLGNT